LKNVFFTSVLFRCCIFIFRGVEGGCVKKDDLLDHWILDNILPQLPFTFRIFQILQKFLKFWLTGVTDDDSDKRGKEDSSEDSSLHFENCFQVFETREMRDEWRRYKELNFTWARAKTKWYELMVLHRIFYGFIGKCKWRAGQGPTANLECVCNKVLSVAIVNSNNKIIVYFEA
jgi:hypothetical protein